jgi:hypothetical protein
MKEAKARARARMRATSAGYTVKDGANGVRVEGSFAGA